MGGKVSPDQNGGNRNKLNAHSRPVVGLHGCSLFCSLFSAFGSGGYQPRITSGHMTHKVTALKPDPETGLERAAFDPMITPKGPTRLAELLQEAA